MNKRILFLAITILTAGTVFTGCQSSAKKVENAKDSLQDAKIEVAEAKAELKQIIKDSVVNYQQFKKESEDRILAHEKSIAEFKTKIANEKKENRAIYEEKLYQLEMKNAELKKNLADYKDDEQTKWNAFRTEFNHDLEELGKAFRDFTVKSDK